MSPRRALLGAGCALLAAPAPGLAITPAVPATLFITSSTYTGTASTLTVGEPLPINPVVDAQYNGTYPTVFFNDTIDGNFGITSPIELIVQPVTIGFSGGTNSGAETRIDVTQLTGIATSFSSKSELGVHLSTDGSAITFTGYHAGLNALDVSNANTAGHVDPTNTDVQTATPRTVVQFNLANASFTTIDTEAYSGNNMRGAIYAPNANGSGANEYLLVGNAGNGSGTEPTYIVNDTGVQLATQAAAPATLTVGVQNGTPGSSTGFEFGFSVTSLGDAADKSGKDDNFRGVTVFNNTMYVSKGSGSNGVDTVYEVLPGNVSGVLPTAANAATTQVKILPGFPTGLAKNITDNSPTTEFYPFDMWFANATTLYVADEGPQDLTTDVNAGLQKWIFNGTSWVLAYTIQAGLNLDRPYSVPGYPAQYDPAVTGLRHLTGIVNGNSVVLYATTSTYSSLGDPGADPNAVVQVVDQLSATSLPTGESFTTVVQPFARTVNRGVLLYPAAYTP
jgi:hypothetical protein